MKYTYEEKDGIFTISRDEVAIATYDKSTDETTYLNDKDKKYFIHVSRLVNQIKNGNTPDDEIVVSKDGETIKVDDKDRLIESLKAEVASLKDQLARGIKPLNSVLLPERYRDEVDLTGSPDQDPKLGDMTPAFIEWAKENMPKDIFEKRYKNRIKQ